MTFARRAVLALTLLLAACDPDGLGKPMPDFLVIGHHGSPLEDAENTIPSMRAALDSGANAVEIDVCITEDDIVVLLHDCDPDSTIALARQSGGEGYLYIPAVPPVGSPWRRPVNQLTLDELRLHYGYAKFGAAQDPTKQIPTLDQFLAYVRTEKRLKAIYVDQKTGPETMGTLVRLVGALSAKDLVPTKFYLLSVHTEVTKAQEAERKRLGVEFPRVAFDSEAPGALAETRAEGLRDLSIGFTPARTWSGLKIEVEEAVSAREAGEVDSVMVWTIDRETELAELLYYSVDGVITNEPKLLFDMWQSTLK